MSGLPPTLSAETGTPAHEWAQSTTTAAFEREEAAPASGATPAFPRESAATTSGATPAFVRENAALAPTSGASYLPPGALQTRTASSASTPGIPGAYPREETGPTNTEAVTQAAKDAMNTVTTTAQQYLPVVQETAAQAAQRAAEVASQATQAVQNYMCMSLQFDGPGTRLTLSHAQLAPPRSKIPRPFAHLLRTRRIRHPFQAPRRQVHSQRRTSAAQEHFRVMSLRRPSLSFRTSAAPSAYLVSDYMRDRQQHILRRLGFSDLPRSSWLPIYRSSRCPRSCLTTLDC